MSASVAAAGSTVQMKQLLCDGKLKNGIAVAR